MEITSDENTIAEQWEFVGTKMRANEQGKRIDWLRENYLIKHS